MSPKRSVVVNDSLLAEARRAAGVRTSAAAVNAALREFVERRGGNGAAESGRRGKTKQARGGIDDLMKLSEYLRESGWDDAGSRLLRKRLARAGGGDS